MLLLAAVNRHVHTGENSSDMLESVCKRVAAQVPIRLIKPGGKPLICGVGSAIKQYQGGVPTDIMAVLLMGKACSMHVK